MNRKAVVAGATGLIGSELVKLLISEPEYGSVTLLVRRPTGLSHPKLEEKIIDFDLLEQADLDLDDADVFCSLGTTIKKAGSQAAFRRVDYEYPLMLGRMAKSQNSRQFLIVSAIGASLSSPFFYNRIKGEVEEALRQIGLKTLIILRPSLLLGNRSEFRFGEKVSSFILRVVSPLLMGPLQKYRPIQAKTVAEAMGSLAKKSLKGIHVFESASIVLNAI